MHKHKKINFCLLTYLQVDWTVQPLCTINKCPPQTFKKCFLRHSRKVRKKLIKFDDFCIPRTNQICKAAMVIGEPEL